MTRTHVTSAGLSKLTFSEEIKKGLKEAKAVSRDVVEIVKNGEKYVLKAHSGIVGSKYKYGDNVSAHSLGLDFDYAQVVRSATMFYDKVTFYADENGLQHFGVGGTDCKNWEEFNEFLKTHK